MKQKDHDRHSTLQPNRRTVLKGAASAAALGAGGALGTFSEFALAQANLRAQITQIPGIGKGAPISRMSKSTVPVAIACCRRGL